MIFFCWSGFEGDISRERSQRELDIQVAKEKF